MLQAKLSSGWQQGLHERWLRWNLWLPRRTRQLLQRHVLCCKLSRQRQQCLQGQWLWRYLFLPGRQVLRGSVLQGGLSCEWQQGLYERWLRGHLFVSRGNGELLQQQVLQGVVPGRRLLWPGGWLWRDLRLSPGIILQQQQVYPQEMLAGL